MIRDLNRLSDGIDENNQNSARRKLGALGRFGRSALRHIGPINTVLNLMEHITPPREETWNTTGTAWRIYRKCAAPHPAYNLGYSGVARSGLEETASTHGFVNSCLAGQSVPAAALFDPFNPAYVTESYRSTAVGRTTTVPGPSYRVQCQISFVRNEPSSSAPYPQLQAAINSAYSLPALPRTSWPITAFPDAFAPLVTPAFADAVPWALVPYRKKDDERELPHLQPSRKPVVWSIAITAPTPGTSSNGFGKPPKYHDYVAPSERKSNDKERKMKAGPRLAKVLRFLGAATEAGDAIDALYKALPQQYRPRWKNTKYVKRNVTYREKLKALYDHWEHLPMDEAVYNLLHEATQDMIYGRLGKIGGKISHRLGHDYGVGINSSLKRTHNLTRGFDFDAL